MMQFKKILWPTDFSEPSYRALETALELTKRFEAELHAVHVIGPIPMMGAPGAPMAFNVAGYRTELEADARKRLQTIVADRIPGEVEAHQHVLHGEAADRITDLADELSADLIVISTHGLTGLRHFIHGSVAEKVVRFSTCPVMSIRAPEKKDEG